MILPKKYRLYIVFIMASIDALFLHSMSKSRLLTSKLNSEICSYFASSRVATKGRPCTKRTASPSYINFVYFLSLSRESTSLYSRLNGCTHSISYVPLGKKLISIASSLSSNMPSRNVGRKIMRSMGHSVPDQSSLSPGKLAYCSSKTFSLRFV